MRSRCRTADDQRHRHDGYATANWWRVAVPRGAPPPIINRLNKEMNAVPVVPDVEKRLINEGGEPSPRRRRTWGPHVRTEMAKCLNIAAIKGE